MMPYLNILMLPHGRKINSNILNTFFKCPVSWCHLSLLVKNPCLSYWRGGMATVCSHGRPYLSLPRPLVTQASLKRWSGTSLEARTWERTEEASLSAPLIKKLPRRHPLIETTFSFLPCFFDSNATPSNWNIACLLHRCAFLNLSLKKHLTQGLLDPPHFLASPFRALSILGLRVAPRRTLLTLW